MPNVKLFVDETLWPRRADALRAKLAPMRELLCRELDVPVAACQLAIAPVWGMEDQPNLNIELSILPRPDRTRTKLEGLGGELRALFAPAVGEARIAVRFSALDPETYVALK